MINKKQKQIQSKKFSAVILDCPASLQFIAKFFQFFGLSFSAVQFAKTSTENYENQQTKSSEIALRNDSRLTKSGAIFIAFNIFCILAHTSQFFIGYIDSDSLSFTESINVTDGADQTIAKYLSGNVLKQIGIYYNGFNDFKPILRFIFRAILYVVVCDVLCNYAASMWHGGLLLRHLASITSAQNREPDHAGRWSLGHRLIAILLLIAVTILMTGLLTYDIRFVPDELQNRFHVTTIFTFHFMEYIVLSFPAVLFLYAMIEYRREIKRIGNDYLASTNNSGDNQHRLALFKVRDRLEKLSEHFRETIETYFQLPLTIASMTNVYIIITGCCFLILINERMRAAMFSAFLLNFAIFGFMRMCAICVAANFATNAADQLIVDLYRRQSASSVWTVRRWICFDEIKRLRHHFRPTLFGTCALRQSSAVGFLGFALGYIVVLLQTETFTSN